MDFFRIVKRKYRMIRGRYYRNCIRKQKTENRKIVFIVFVPQMWNSLKPIYELAVKSDEFETSIIVLPYTVKINNDVSVNSIDYWKDYENVILCQDESECPTIKELDADIVFRQTPYDERYPEVYSTQNIAKYAKLVYVPYNYNSSKIQHLYIEYNYPFLSNVYALFVDSKHLEWFCKDTLRRNPLLRDIGIYHVGCPRFDIYRKWKNERKSGKPYCFLWIPRWSVDFIGNNSSGFLKYYKKMIEYFKNCKNAELIIRPHPFMFEQFEKNNVMEIEEIRTFMNIVNEIENIFLDSNVDYLPAFQRADAMIADMSSLVNEFFLTGKPILYCDPKDDQNKDVREIYQLVYKTFDWKTLKEQMERLMDGLDEFLDKRIKIKTQFLEGSYSDVANTILKICKTI